MRGVTPTDATNLDNRKVAAINIVRPYLYIYTKELFMFQLYRSHQVLEESISFQYCFKVFSHLATFK